MILFYFLFKEFVMRLIDLLLLPIEREEGKKTIASVFNELIGIGPKRKKKLLLHFGSIEKIKNASKKELKSVQGVPEAHN